MRRGLTPVIIKYFSPEPIGKMDRSKKNTRMAVRYIFKIGPGKPGLKKNWAQFGRDILRLFFDTVAVLILIKTNDCVKLIAFAHLTLRLKCKAIAMFQVVRSYFIISRRNKPTL